jgi:transcriptional regulator with XRE-family HTH domain
MLSSGLMYNCQLCYDLGVTESSLSRWRSGGPMSVAMAVELAEKLGVSLEWLVKGGGGGDEADHAARDRDEVTNLFAALRPADRQLVLALNRALMNHQAAAEAA